MPTNDNLQITFTAGELQEVNDALATLERVLGPKFITLTKKEMQRLPKAGDGTLPFIQQALDLAEQQPKFAPAYLDVPGLRLDLEAWQKITGIQRRLQPLVTGLSHTGVKLGSESFVASLTYYNSSQEAARRAVPGAIDVVNVLKPRFEQDGGAAPDPQA